jgi:hypothetical protein
MTDLPATIPTQLRMVVTDAVAAAPFGAGSRRTAGDYLTRKEISDMAEAVLRVAVPMIRRQILEGVATDWERRAAMFTAKYLDYDDRALLSGARELRELAKKED